MFFNQKKITSSIMNKFRLKLSPAAIKMFKHLLDNFKTKIRSNFCILFSQN